ncbi:MAG: glycosyltransferase [Candidatus Pacearchaeota archaeon]
MVKINSVDKKERLKISFLVAAHNEERTIGKCLENLLSIPYKNYEIIVGLDGCTDKTEEIVKYYAKKEKRIKYYTLNLRQGKNVVINSIIKKASGDICIINDADWIFVFKDKSKFHKMIKYFDDSNIGGIAESFPAEWHKDLIQNGNIGYKMYAYSSYLWFEFQKKKFCYRKNNFLYLKEPTMFLTNIFRKKLYQDNKSLGDDFERTADIMNRGYSILMLEDIDMPRIKTTYYYVSVKDLFRQKIRTGIARNQLSTSKKMNVSLTNYYLPVTWFIFKNSWKFGIKIGFIITLWIFIMVVTTFISKIKKINTKEGWALRVNR